MYSECAFTFKYLIGYYLFWNELHCKNNIHLLNTEVWRLTWEKEQIRLSWSTKMWQIFYCGSWIIKAATTKGGSSHDPEVKQTVNKQLSVCPKSLVHDSWWYRNKGHMTLLVGWTDHSATGGWILKSYQTQNTLNRMRVLMTSFRTSPCGEVIVIKGWSHSLESPPTHLPIQSQTMLGCQSRCPRLFPLITNWLKPEWWSADHLNKRQLIRTTWNGRHTQDI